MSEARTRMVNWRATAEDQRVLKGFRKVTGRTITFIMRRAIRKLQVEDLLLPLTPEEQAADDIDEERESPAGGPE